MILIDDTQQYFREAAQPLADLAGVWQPEGEAGATCVLPAEVPEPFHWLLVHHEHMTTRLEQFHSAPVRLEVASCTHAGDVYTRCIRLHPGPAETVTEVGVARIHLQYLASDVRNEILERRRPLGEILIAYDVLRDIQPRWFYRFDAGSPLLSHFDKPDLEQAYGRVGVIHCEQAPAIELLELVSAAS